MSSEGPSLHSEWSPDLSIFLLGQIQFCSDNALSHSAMQCLNRKIRKLSEPQTLPHRKRCKKQNIHCNTTYWLSDHRIYCIPQEKDYKVKGRTDIFYGHPLVLGGGSLLNQLLYYLIMQMKEFFGYATLSDSANQFHILSVALFIVPFSIDTVSLLVKILLIARHTLQVA